jgi:hypothetical protein
MTTYHDIRERRATEAQNKARELTQVLADIRGLEHDPTHPTPFTYSELWHRAEILSAAISRRAGRLA